VAVAAAAAAAAADLCVELTYERSSTASHSEHAAVTPSGIACSVDFRSGCVQLVLHWQDCMLATSCCMSHCTNTARRLNHVTILSAVIDAL